MIMTTTDRPSRLAAPAPLEADDEQLDHESTEPKDGPSDAELHALCERWARWCQTRRYYGRNSLPPSILGRLTTKGSGRSVEGGPDAECSAELAAFHLAVLAQPPGKARQVFEIYYLHRVKNVKIFAAALGIGRQHWYTLLRRVRKQIFESHIRLREEALAGSIDARIGN